MGRTEPSASPEKGEPVSIRITVPGRPVPKGRPRLGVRGRKAFVYTPERTVEYERLVGLCAAAARSGDVLECPVAVKIDLHLHGKRRIDVDNCAKSILDGMNGVVYLDDNQVVDLRVRKLREKNKKEQRVEVEVWEAGENAGTG